MELIGNLISVREDVRVLDATLRDGGLVNDFFFPDEFVRALYQMNSAAGVDYMEFGYKASKRVFDPQKFGKWKFCDDEDIRAVVGDNPNGPKISVMADVGRCDYQQDILPAAESPIDMIRVATYIETIPEAITMIEDAVAKGYEVTCNLMAVSKCQESEIEIGLKLLAQAPIQAMYIVDSFGSLYPEEIRRLVALYNGIMEPAGIRLGIHAHNNQQCAFANTIEGLSVGVSYLDATVCGMGRGAGNCALENLLGFLKNPKYQINPALQFIEQHMLPLKATGLKWGYDIPYMLTGLTNQHPRTAIAAVKDGDTKYTDFYQMLLD